MPSYTYNFLLITISGMKDFLGGISLCGTFILFSLFDLFNCGGATYLAYNLPTRMAVTQGGLENFNVI